MFSQDDCDYGYTTIIKHSIPAGNAHPIRQQHPRIPPHVFQEVKHRVQDLIRQNDLAEGCSPWTSSAVTVMKKDGSVWICFLL